MLDELNGVAQIVIAGILVMNIFSFVLYYVDKRRAINRKFRISEKSLLLTSFAFGGIGAWLGMKIFRHKTKHKLFIYSLPVAAVLTGIVLIVVAFPLFG